MVLFIAYTASRRRTATYLPAFTCQYISPIRGDVFIDDSAPARYVVDFLACSCCVWLPYIFYINSFLILHYCHSMVFDRGRCV